MLQEHSNLLLALSSQLSPSADEAAGQGALVERKPRSVLPTALTAMSPVPCEPAASPARSPGHLCFYLLALQSAVATWKRGHLAVPLRTGASPALDTAPGDQQHWV